MFQGRAAGVAYSQSSAILGGRYRLLALLGKGGMGRVWRAYDELLHRTVAVKEIPVGATGQAWSVREARAAARLDHPNVIRVYDILQTADRSWIVMRYVAGRSLHETVRQDGPLGHRQAARIGLAVLEALRAAHAAGVVHRDVKPQNVLLGTDGSVVLTDFGLATVAADPDPSGDETAAEFVGSPQYVAPERYRDQVSGPETDLWSLGATLYAIVEGRPPFARATVAETLAALLTDDPLAPVRPGPLHPVIDRLLDKNPGQRMTATAAYEALRDVTSRTVGVSAVPKRPRIGDDVVRFRPAAAVPAISAPLPHRPRGSRRVLILLAAAIAAGLAGAAVAATRENASAAPSPGPTVSATASACGSVGEPLTGAGAAARNSTQSALT